MADYTAVKRGKDRFKRMALSFDLMLIRLLLRYVYRNSDRAHNRAVKIEQRRFIGSKHSFALTRVDYFL